MCITKEDCSATEEGEYRSTASLVQNVSCNHNNCIDIYIYIYTFYDLIEAFMSFPPQERDRIAESYRRKSDCHTSQGKDHSTVTPGNSQSEYKQNAACLKRSVTSDNELSPRCNDNGNKRTKLENLAFTDKVSHDLRSDTSTVVKLHEAQGKKLCMGPKSVMKNHVKKTYSSFLENVVTIYVSDRRVAETRSCKMNTEGIQADPIPSYNWSSFRFGYALNASIDMNEQNLIFPGLVRISQGKGCNHCELYTGLYSL